MTSLLLLGLMGKCGFKGDMAEGFKALQIAVDDRNFQEGLITALPRSGLLEPFHRANALWQVASSRRSWQTLGRLMNVHQY